MITTTLGGDDSEATKVGRTLGRRNRMKIAIVDDNETSRLFMDMLLKSDPEYSTISFESSEDAQTWLESNTVDLLIVDYMMPKLDGIDVITGFRRSPRSEGVPIIMVTAYEEREVRSRAVAAGATDFIGKPVEIIEFKARVRNLLALRAAGLAHRQAAVVPGPRLLRDRAVLRRWALSVAERDAYDAGHPDRITRLVQWIAEGVALEEGLRECLLLAAPLYDVGKTLVPDGLLGKSDALSAEETLIMRDHTRHGHRMFAGTGDDVLETIAEIALNHHERIDGSGYPGGLTGDEIPSSARIVAVADVFEAITRDRPYRAAQSADTALEILESQAGIGFDEACVNALLARAADVRTLARST